MESALYSVSTEDITFPSGHLQLSGSLLFPTSSPPLSPAIIFVHGAGDETREPCRSYAELFARQGISALIYDKRGTGQSQGNWRCSTFADLAQDALAAFHFLQTRPGLDPQKIGLCGISEGGWIIPLAASLSSDIAFLIAVSAAGMNPARAETYHQQQLRALLPSSIARLRNACYWQTALLSIALGRYLPTLLIPQASLFAYATRTFTFDPLPIWQQVRQPVLFIWGEQDIVVPPTESQQLIQQTLTRNNHPDTTYEVFPEGDHGIRHNGTHLPGYFPLMISWLKAHTS